MTGDNLSWVTEHILKRMARDLESWANAAETIQRVRRQPLLESSIALH
jgi:hypothetical protein